MASSEAVNKQFAPSFLEAVQYGKPDPFEAGRRTGGIYGLERIYEDRAIITPFFGCASYCRYCFKKTRTLGGPNTLMSDEDVAAALDYIKADPRIDTVLITGGDPLAKPALTLSIVQQIAAIPHINKIRIGTRHILFQPTKITQELARDIAACIRINDKQPRRSLNVSLAVSLNHPDELQPEVVQAIHRLTQAGITVRGQMVLLKGINDNAPTIRELIDTFLTVGIVPYYLCHCMPVSGSCHMRTSVRKGCQLLATLEQFSTAYAVSYIYNTPVGKHRVGSESILKYEIIDRERYIVARTPYRAANFLEFSGQDALPPLHDVDENGFIISRYLDGTDDAVDGW